jgi:hypothetical protein
MIRYRLQPRLACLGYRPFSRLGFHRAAPQEPIQRCRCVTIEWYRVRLVAGDPTSKVQSLRSWLRLEEVFADQICD